MSPTNWNFYSYDGNYLTQGWQGFEDQAYALAQKMANERGENVGFDEYGSNPEGEPTWVEPEEPKEDDDTISATLYEAGNGFPEVGDFTAGDDGELYEIVELCGRIQTNGPGVGNSIECKLVLASWEDEDEDEDDNRCFPCKCVLGEE